MTTKKIKNIKQVSIESLIPYSRNSRTHSDAQIAQIAGSIQAFGFTQPVLIDAENGIIAGHGRVLAARKLGMKTVPVIVLDYMSESQKRAYIIADNKLAENAGWDDELLALELGDLKEHGFDLSLTGFSESELAELMLPADEEETAQDAEEIPDPVTKPGDAWTLGAIRVECGTRAATDDCVSCDVIVRRWQNFTGEKAHNEATGQLFDDLDAARK